jgi:DNA-binding NarL/FixJ family response regulator
VSPPPRIARRERVGPLRVAILSDDALLRSALAHLFTGDDMIVVEGEGEVALWDSGIDAASFATRVTEAASASAPIVALVTARGQAEQALHAGARAVMLRERAGPELASALWAVAGGLTVIDQALADELFPARRPPARADALTAREREVVALLADGLSNKRIARRLGISEHTAKFHVNRIMEKLGADTRTEAVVRAMRLGMLMM